MPTAPIVMKKETGGASFWGAPWALHSASHIFIRGLRYGLILVIVIGASRVAVRMWPRYYTNPTARDNYAGVARYVQAMGNAATDWVLLDAPGQQEVWRYYDPGLPVLALPQQRPPNPQQTLAMLAKAAQDHRQIFALFWATAEADPQRLVEQWLDQNAFKGWESWQGNLRFVTYRLPTQLTCAPLAPDSVFEQQIALLEQCQPALPQRIAAGEVALLGLRWQALAKIEQRYKVSVQLLDARNQVIAQHDSEPAGGSQPTDQWQPQTIVSDNHGLTIPFGTPPIVYRLMVAIYDPQTGQRLHVGALDQLELSQLEVTRPQRTIPLAILPIQHWTNATLGGVRLLGYDLYRKNYAHAPATPIQPGDLVQVTFYWQAPDPLPANWPPASRFQLTLGSQVRTEELVPGYPTQQWQPGDILRGEFDIPFDGTDRVPTLLIGESRLSLVALPR